MSVSFIRPRFFLFGLMTVAALGQATAGSAQAENQISSELRERLARTGIYFRADAPAVLRNNEDPYLPVYLEIINGVEKTAGEPGSILSRLVQRDPLNLLGVNIFAKPSGAAHPFANEPLDLGSGKDFSFDARNDNQPLVISDRMRKTLEVPVGRLEENLSRHYPGSPQTEAVDLRIVFQLVKYPAQDFYLRVRLRAPPLPQIPGWYRGDTHYHSAYTDNPAERGAPLPITKEVALHAGLNWVVLSDHSSDLRPDTYAKELQEAARYRDGRFLFIRGEEVTVASGKKDVPSTLHLLAFPSPNNPDEGFADPSGKSDDVIESGTGSVSSPPLPLKDVLLRIASADGFAYAAHPFDPLSPVVRGGVWDLERDFFAPGLLHLQPGLVGLEAWNRATVDTADDARDPLCIGQDPDPGRCFQADEQANQYARLEKAIELGWRPLLIRGLQLSEAAADAPAFKVFLVAGSDAHGDFNYEATMDVVDFIRKPSRLLSGYAEDNALGKLVQVVHCPAGMGPKGENILHAMGEGKSVASNGPLLIAGFDRNANGSLDDPEDVGLGHEISSRLGELPLLQLEWVSSDEFGPFYSVRVISGSRAGESEPEEITIPPSKALASQGLFAVDLRPRLEKASTLWNYLRLEARTRNSAGKEFRCYTNPIWVRLTDR